VTNWLERAAEAGADVWLIAPERVPGLPGEALVGSGPGAFARALDAADQLRPVDAVLAAGARERAWLRLAPRALRGTVDALAPDSDPVATADDLQKSCRTPSDSQIGDHSG
jgi:hypothetical protein